MIADAFETEWEVIGKTINLRKVEYFKDNPLPLSYGRGNAWVCAVRNGLIRMGRPDGKFAVSWMRIGSFAGIQIFLDNFIYTVMVCRMVNAVSESGNYWVANNFIWGWMLVQV